MVKTTVVTGATSGIGYETALQLAGRGQQLILLCRNESKAESTIKTIREQTGNDKVHYIITDLESQSQIRNAAKQILERFESVDCLVNNAGIWSSKRELTEDGIEKVLAVNHLSFFLLTHCLYNAISRSDDPRIINVSSDSHFQTRMFLEDLSLKKKYHGLRSYAQSKLANVLFTYELDRLKPDKNVTVNAVQPGLVKTDIGMKDTNWIHALAWKIRRSGGSSPAEGAATSVYLASAESARGLSGLYWDSMKPKRSSKNSYNEENAKQLWEISLKLCNIDNYFSKEI